MTRKTIKVSNITCAQCAKSIETYFDTLDGIDAKVLVTSKKVIFNYDETQYDVDQIANHLRIIGYYPILNSEEQEKAKKRDLIDLILAGILTFPLLWTMFVHLGIKVYVPDFLMNGYVQWAIATPILFYVGRRFFQATYHQIKGRNLGMDTLVVLGTSAAYIFSIYQTLSYTSQAMHQMPDLYFETTAVIIFMVMIGNFFENRVKEKTSNALQSLISLSAKEARVIRDGQEMMLPVDDVKPGDIISVLANEKIGLDGIILKGKSYVDEAMITGEPMPAFKEVGDQVIGSTLNMIETLEIKVTAVGSDTVLANIIQMVEDTALIKPKAQRLADKVAALFVPVVVFISLTVFVLWAFVVNGGYGLSVAFAPAIAVLVISCPCALGLATPTSISVGSGIAFKEGILYKGGEFFEIANKISAIAFDKTGTLTKGHPELSDFLGDKKTLAYSASLEKHSNHPIAKAITDAYEDDYLEVTDFEVMLGKGVKGTINQKEVYVGSPNMLKDLNLVPSAFDYKLYLSQGKTVFFTVVDLEIVNMIAVEDPIKETAKGVITELKKRNITPYMITGDQEITAQYIASILGIEHVFAEVLPHEKAEKILEIQKTGKIVAFVGDGINDAPALKMADVGFAVGSGSDIAIDTSDVTLMSYDLGLVIKAIDLSLATLKNIYLNFFWAFAYNIVMIPLAAYGLLNPSLAGIGMGFSSIMVVLNALSLNLFKFKNIPVEE
ncbi:MAG: heavy metal translocating P-type ATPase [Firmicutes bacterium]|nr:heavy metal translocating P-type ATPase [Bacillota bacterium]